jgi:signal peptidase I
MSFFRDTISFFWQIAKIVVISLAIIVPIRYFLFQPFFVRGASMYPSFASGDYLIINEIGYRIGDPERGDVIVFRPPQEVKQFYIKRVIGLPGEVVKIEDGKVRVGKSEGELAELSEEYISDLTPGVTHVTLGSDEYFLLGDNRNASSDSRNWGPLTRDHIIGKALLRAWPVSDFKIIDQPSYGPKAHQPRAD